MASLFSTYTKEELLKKLKTQKLLFTVKVIVIILMFVFAFYSTTQNGVSFYTFLPLFFIPMAYLMYADVKKIKEELDKRK